MSLFLRPPHPSMKVLESAAPAVLAPLPYVLGLCSLVDLQQWSHVSREVSAVCETEWRLRTLARFGDLRFSTNHWRRCFLLRAQFQRQAVQQVTARVYLMNNRGETRCIPIERGTPLLCSRERAVLYHRCKSMFDLSLRINRSIQEISTLVGMVSVDEARGLLQEHIRLMAAVAALRSSLDFESDLFPILPAPVLLDTNSLLRVTHNFKAKHDAAFLQSALIMMHVWVSIDGLIYRPLSPPATIQQTPDLMQQSEANVEVETMAYSSLKLHNLSAMSMAIDDNTLRYRLQGDEICVNALVSNTYLLYLFNPLQYRPLDWKFDAMLQVGDTRYVLPVQREGVFLNTTSYALRIFLSYGKLPGKLPPLSNEDATNDLQTKEIASGEVKDVTDAAEKDSSTDSARRAEDSESLAIPYDGKCEIFAFHLTATNRITKKTCVVASKATCLSLLRPANRVSAVERRFRQQSIGSSPTRPDERGGDADRSGAASTTLDDRVPSLERHVPLPFDAMICYCFAPNCSLQYVEFAIGFEPLMHLLGVADFLPEAIAAC